jgi:hypothetical protein
MFIYLVKSTSPPRWWGKPSLDNNNKRSLNCPWTSPNTLHGALTFTIDGWGFNFFIVASHNKEIFLRWSNLLLVSSIKSSTLACSDHNADGVSSPSIQSLVNFFILPTLPSANSITVLCIKIILSTYTEIFTYI